MTVGVLRALLTRDLAAEARTWYGIADLGPTCPAHMDCNDHGIVLEVTAQDCVIAVVPVLPKLRKACAIAGSN